MYGRRRIEQAGRGGVWVGSDERGPMEFDGTGRVGSRYMRE
jgi:hypothetical protein